MTEREKMYAEKIYDPFCEGMPEERTKAHRLCKEYNDTLETEIEKRNAILDELLPNRGANVYLQGPIFFDFGTNISMGDGSYANFNFTVLDEGKVNIGKSVFIGPNVSILTAIHPLCYQDRNSFCNPKTGCVTNLEYTGSVTIEDNCWIAANVTICGPATIGAGSVIAAGAVVTGDIPADSLAMGIPCRVVRKITEKDRLREHPELFAESDNRKELP